MSHDAQIDLTREEAQALYGLEFWNCMEPRDIAEFQLHTRRLCMPFGVFHESVEKALDRPVFTHEFAAPDHLIAELRGDAPAPTLSDILDMIPADKRVVIRAAHTREEEAEA